MSVQDAIVSYLDSARLMQIATCIDGQPWCATVYFAHDNAHNLYWVSLPSTRHSQELGRNPQIAGTIVDGSVVGKPPRGVQFYGTATEVPTAEIHSAIEAYAERYQRFTLGEEIVAGRSPLRLYRTRPTAFVLYDQDHFPENPRQEWKLTEA